MAGRVGYLEEKGYAVDGNVIRHGDVLRDVMVDQSTSMRVLGMIGQNDVALIRSEVLNGSAPMAYMVLAQGNNVMTSKVRYTNANVDVYGLDIDLLNVKQVVRVEIYGYTAMSIITLTEG